MAVGTEVILSRLTASLLLLFASTIWGSTFVVQKWVAAGPDSIGPLAFTGARFVLGALVVGPLAWRETRNAAAPMSRLHRLGFLACGIAVLAGGWAQQTGIRGTSIGNAGFLTGLYVAFVPLLAWGIFRQRPHSVVWPAIGVCLVGAWLLTGATWAPPSAGDAWILLCSLFWAVHVTLVGVTAAASGRPLSLAFCQFAVAGTLGLLLAQAVEGPPPIAYLHVAGEIAWAGFLSAGVGFTLQVVGQRHLHPAAAAIIMSAEAVFAAIAGALAFGERMSHGQLAGAGLIFAAIIAVELVPMLAASRRRA